MCEWCGLLWCSDRCPNYLPQNDAHFVRFCEQCGEPVWEPNEEFCDVCKEEQHGTQ